MNLIDLAERGALPDALIRFGIRRLLAPRAREARELGPAGLAEHLRGFLRELRESPIAVSTAAANVQHYEAPTEFFLKILGPRLKYSCCVWPKGVNDLASAEERTLALTAERAGISDGMSILDLGCGWGSFSLWAGERFPSAKILAVSNSRTQRAFIEDRARERGLTNLEVRTVNAGDFEPDRDFDRVVSVEMFEHLRNVEAMFARLRPRMRPGGKVFLHVFCHRCLPYVFPTDGPTDWMGREFFTGGMMPSDDLYSRMNSDFVLEDQWRIDGRDYARTLRAWLLLLDRNREDLLEILKADGSGRDPRVSLGRWRLFLMACEELFAYDRGREWFVSHYRFGTR